MADDGEKGTIAPFTKPPPRRSYEQEAHEQAQVRAWENYAAIVEAVIDADAPLDLAIALTEVDASPELTERAIEVATGRNVVPLDKEG